MSKLTEKQKKIVMVILVALFIVGFICGIAVGLSRKNKESWIIKEVLVDGVTVNGIATVQKWDELSFCQQFVAFQYNGNQYDSKKTKISSNNIKEKIGESILEGYDTYTTNTYNKKGELYSIKDIADKCAVAVKFEGDTDYYVYVNVYYRPNTLGEFMEDLGLKEITSFGTIYYDYVDENGEQINVEFYNVDNEIIWQKLFDDLDLKNVYSDTGEYELLQLSYSIKIGGDIPKLGHHSIVVSLTDKGYMLTSVLGTEKAFYIGEEKIQEFLKYLKANYDGYQIVYVDVNENDNTTDEENRAEDEEIIVTVVNEVNNSQN